MTPSNESQSGENRTQENDEEVEIREFSDVRHSDDLVREYTTPPGNVLYVYRSEDGDEHIVVSRGDEPNTRWEKRIPATVDRPIPGQTRWSVPDNWTCKVISSGDMISRGLYYVPESDIWAKITMPTNDWLVDAYYTIDAVGQLTADAGHLGDSTDVRSVAKEAEEIGDDDFAEAIHRAANNWHAVRKELEITLEWVTDEGLESLSSGRYPIRAGPNFELEFHHDYIFKPESALEQTDDFDDVAVEVSEITGELRHSGLLPGHYSFGLSIAEETDMEYYIRALIERTASPAEAIDYYMTEVRGMSQKEWSNERGVDQSTVSSNKNQVL